MRLTSFTDYALRVLIFLGVHRGRLVQRAEIAGAFDISENHIGKVVHHLAKLGLILAKRGRGGGLSLATEPEQIVIGDVVRAFEPDFSIVECFDAERNNCAISPVCGLANILDEAEQAFQGVLASYTLADVLNVRGRSQYKKLLGP